LTAIHQRMLRRFYLRLLLGAYLGLPGKDLRVSRPARGKPVLDPAFHPESLDFSLAASDGCCLVGVTGGAPVGVDLEPEGRQAGRPLALARRYFSDEEVRALESLPEHAVDAAFLRAWACKEAWVKASGLGIANQLRRFTVEVAPDRPVALSRIEGDDADAWRMAELRPAPGFLGVVTARQPALELRCWRLQPPPGLAGP
jgi:4'-phosphopantetheinyl transferase